MGDHGLGEQISWWANYTSRKNLNEWIHKGKYDNNAE